MSRQFEVDVRAWLKPVPWQRLIRRKAPIGWPVSLGAVGGLGTLVLLAIDAYRPRDTWGETLFDYPSAMVLLAAGSAVLGLFLWAITKSLPPERLRLGWLRWVSVGYLLSFAAGMVLWAASLYAF
jgi:hypothetical protein